MHLLFLSFRADCSQVFESTRNMSLVLFVFTIMAYRITRQATGLQISLNDARESVFPIAPGFTGNRHAYILGAYALFDRSVIRFVSIPSSLLQQSSISGTQPDHVDLDKNDGSNLHCLYGTEVSIEHMSLHHIHISFYKKDGIF